MSLEAGDRLHACYDVNVDSGQDGCYEVDDRSLECLFELVHRCRRRIYGPESERCRTQEVEPKVGRYAGTA